MTETINYYELNLISFPPFTDYRHKGTLEHKLSNLLQNPSGDEMQDEQLLNTLTNKQVTVDGTIFTVLNSVPIDIIHTREKSGI